MKLTKEEEKEKISDLVQKGKHINKKLVEEQDLLLMLIVSLRKAERSKIINIKKRIKSLELLSEKVVRADKKDLKILDLEVNSLFKN